MLIRFKVANLLSFKEETEFSMVADKERIYSHHVVKGEKNQPNLLRAALLYGANAAGCFRNKPERTFIN
jgi:AAA15 family ATPase/GTPase